MNHEKYFPLRPLKAEEAESLAQQLNNKEVWDNLRDVLPYPYSIEDANVYIEFQANEPSITCYGIEVEGKIVAISALSATTM